MKAMQFAIFVGFVLCNIYFEWGLDGLTAGVMGGMAAYYVTKVIMAFRGELPPLNRSGNPELPELPPALSLPASPAERPVALLQKP